MITTGISWTDSTFNAWEGCTKVGPGCDHCYAETRNGRFHAGANWGPGAPRLLRSDAYWREPIKWNAAHAEFFAKHGRRQRVFCSSLADVFDNEAPAGQRERLFELIRNTPNLDWLLLTKRIGNAAKMLPADWGNGYPNAWLGASIVNQEEADRDILKLLATPAHIRFLSMEPLLGPVDLTKEYLAANLGKYPFKGLETKHRTSLLQMLDWIIVGGESGTDARPMHPDWARSLRDQCAAAGVPYFFKQWGEWLPFTDFPYADISILTADIVPGENLYQDGSLLSKDNWQGQDGNAATMYKVGKVKAGEMLEGVRHQAFPVILS